MKGKYWGNTAAFPSNATETSKCRWTASAKTRRYLNPISANDEQLKRDVAAQVATCYDPN